MPRRRNGKMSAMRAAMIEAQRDALECVLIGAGWSVPTAARALGVSAATIYRLVRKLKLMKPGKVMVRRLVKA